MPTQSSSWINHEGVVDCKGNSCFRYRNGALSGGGGYTRSVCMLFNFNWWKFDPIATGTGSSGGNCREKRNEIKIIITSGKVKTLHLDFSSSVSQGTVNVCLLGHTGRLVTILFKRQLNTKNLMIPLDRAETGLGIYMIKASLNKKVILAKKSCIC